NQGTHGFGHVSLSCADCASAYVVGITSLPPGCRAGGLLTKGISCSTATTASRSSSTAPTFTPPPRPSASTSTTSSFAPTSCAGAFKRLVEALQRKGVRVSVCSTIRSQPPMISDDLRRQADNFIDLEDLREVVGRPPREPRPEGTRPWPREQGADAPAPISAE